jgi:NAD(P)-dependent dehydrogenase (short-subunit alcohol dehydrogenase family)
VTGSGGADEGRFAGRVALVTGAAGDIGRAVALRLAAEGARVVISDLEGSRDQLEAVAAAVRDVGPDPAVATVDVTDETAVAAAVDDLTDRIGPPELVVTCAGIQGAFVALPDHEVTELRTTLEVNVVGTFTVVAAAARALRAAGRPGAIVTVSSMAGVSGAPNMPAYSASKAAVLGLTRSAAKDLAPLGIRVNAICPAFIGPGAMWDRQVEQQAAAPSPYYADTPEDVAAQMVGMVPLGRYGSVDEVAAVVAFLLSDDASYVTGTETEISGGSV